MLGEHLIYKVECAVAGCLGAENRTAEVETFSRERARVLAREFLIHAVHVGYLASAYADVAGRHVLVGAKVAPKLKHEGLAEAHDFCFAAAARGKVRTAFRAAHRQRGKGVLERLLEAEEFKDA